MITKLLLYGFIIISSNLISYKLIRFIDKKERKKIQDWELNFIDNIKSDDLDEIIDDSNKKNDNLEQKNTEIDEEVDDLF